MRNSTLHSILHAFASEAAERLAGETANGAEIPFELIETGHARGRSALYCYRPLTGAFIHDRAAALHSLPTYLPAVRALAELEGVADYLRQRGERIIPTEPRERADSALRALLACVFAERSEFVLEEVRFEAAYAELEQALYEGQCVTTVVAPLFGVALDDETDELALGDGLVLMRAERLPDPPETGIWLDAEPHGVLVVLTVTQERSQQAPVPLARSRFRRLLTALRLFERGGYALGPVGLTRTDTGPWRPIALGGSGRARFITHIVGEQEDELRAFCNLTAKRAPTRGEVAWALSRFEMACERLAPFEALTDYLLALRALLEPEGPSSGRLAGRLAAICAKPGDRALLAERVAHAISLERAVIAGLAPAEPGVDALVDDLAEHLRALLRDVLCGHLEPDLRSVADGLLAQTANIPA